MAEQDLPHQADSQYPSAPATPSFGSGMFGSTPAPAAYPPAPSWNPAPAADSPQVLSGFGGKAAPAIPPFPER